MEGEPRNRARTSEGMQTAMEVLFDHNEQPEDDGGSIVARYSDIYTTHRGAIGRSMSTCSETIGRLQHGETVHLVSMGQWSAEHVIAHITDQCGPMRLLMATWSVSEAAVLRLATAMERGYVTGCRALFDWRVKVRRPNALDIIRQAMDMADIRLDSCHAKVYLLENDDWTVSIVGSPNLTTNPRLEASVITTDRAVWAFHRQWLEAMIDGAKPFEEDRA